MDQAAELPPHELAAVSEYFDGDRDFYVVFRASAVAQFPADLQAGDAAGNAGDAQALRRAAHGLKGVLLTLGYAELSAFAKTVEQGAQQLSWDEAVALWRELRARMVAAFGLA
jgi:HPt (histidine-containing phosphotransfer) domain-containing protein